MSKQLWKKHDGSVQVELRGSDESLERVMVKLGYCPETPVQAEMPATPIVPEAPVAQEEKKLEAAPEAPKRRGLLDRLLNK